MRGWFSVTKSQKAMQAAYGVHYDDTGCLVGGTIPFRSQAAEGFYFYAQAPTPKPVNHTPREKRISAMREAIEKKS